MKMRGFTLIELLVVTGILGVLLTITLVAINPSRQFSQSNNTQRESNVNSILNAINQYAADNRGSLPAGIGTTAATIKKTGGVDICSVLVPTYLAALPVDPTAGSYTDCNTYDTGYTVLKSATNNRVTVAAPLSRVKCYHFCYPLTAY